MAREARLLLLLLDLGAQLGRLLVEVAVPILPRLELRRVRLLGVELLHLGVRPLERTREPRGLRHFGLAVGRSPLHLRLRLGHLPIESLQLALGGQRGRRARLAVVSRLLHRHLAARHALEELLLLVRRRAALGLQQSELGADALELLVGILDARLELVLPLLLRVGPLRVFVALPLHLVELGLGLEPLLLVVRVLCDLRNGWAGEERRRQRGRRGKRGRLGRRAASSVPCDACQAPDTWRAPPSPRRAP